MLHFPPFDEVPPEVRGRSFAIFMAAFLGAEQAARRLLRPMQDLRPVMDTFAAQEPLALGTLAMDPEEPLPFRSTTALVDGLPGETIDALARITGAGSSLTMVQLRHVGGALSRTPRNAGARATLPGEILVFGLGVVPAPDAEAAVARQLSELDAAVASLTVGAYPNLVERPADASTFFDAQTWARLRAVKSSYDTDDLVRGNHHVPAGPAA